MKASVLTLHSVANYGTQLQALATQEKLKQYFDEVEFIDYRRRDTYGVGLLNTFTKGNVIKAIPILPTLFRWKSIFGKFQRKYLNISSHRYLDDEELRNFTEDADVYFTGSDQIWNSGWNKGIVPSFYLNFVSEQKPKYAYCSSFGREKLNNEEVRKTKKFIKRFRYISVREESGVEILKGQYGYQNCIRLIDPTLALDATFWRSICKGKLLVRGKYILIYNLNRNKEFDEYAANIAEKMGLPLYRFCTRYDQILRNGKSLIIPDIEEFVSLIDNAQLVITDSFHATAFSMNLNTEVVCVYPESYSSRISEFLKLVHSEQRHARNFNDLDILSSDRKTDFRKVNEILKEERGRTEQYLLRISREVRDELGN